MVLCAMMRDTVTPLCLEFASRILVLLTEEDVVHVDAQSKGIVAVLVHSCTSTATAQLLANTVTVIRNIAHTASCRCQLLDEGVAAVLVRVCKQYAGKALATSCEAVALLATDDNCKAQLIEVEPSRHWRMSWKLAMLKTRSCGSCRRQRA